MLKQIFIIFILSVSCSFALVSSFQGEADYDKMIMESSKTPNYTPEQIEAMLQAHRAQKNMLVEQKMAMNVRPKIAISKKVQSKDDNLNTPVDESVHGKNIIIAIIVLIIGVFMLLYSYSSFSRKKTG